MSSLIMYLPTISREFGAIVNSFEVLLNFTKSGRLLFFYSYVVNVRGCPSLSITEGRRYDSTVFKATTN